jgi:hypothetical protein
VKSHCRLVSLCTRHRLIDDAVITTCLRGTRVGTHLLVKKRRRFENL